MSSSITIGSNTYTLISLPSSPGLSSIDVTFEDSVALVSSPFVPSQIQTQAWPGADAWSVTFTLPKMIRAMAAPWRGVLAELRGMQNVFQIGDPFCTAPLGVATGTPVCNTTGANNLAMATSLVTSGWTHSVTGILLAGDYIQLGYRLYQVCENVNSDSSGNVTIPIWPSLRESPAYGSSLVLNNTKGLFRLAQNQRSWHGEYGGLLQISFKCSEVR